MVLRELQGMIIGANESPLNIFWVSEALVVMAETAKRATGPRGKGRTRSELGVLS